MSAWEAHAFCVASMHAGSQADSTHAVQMKKACLTRRAEMMKDMDKKGDLPLSLLASMKQKGGAAPQKASPPQSAAESSRHARETFLGGSGSTIVFPPKACYSTVLLKMRPQPSCCRI